MTAARLGVPVFEHELEAQFRCGGSEAFVGWVENTLELARTPFTLWDPSEEFDFDVVDSPKELEALIRAKQQEGFSARLTAGFCWRWSDPRPDGTLESDVKIDGWTMPWNAKQDAGKLAKGIPKSNYWATDPGGIDQVGCVYTAQGFEFDYAGVIFGRDLVWRPRKGWVGQPEFSQDSIVEARGQGSGRVHRAGEEHLPGTAHARASRLLRLLRGRPDPRLCPVTRRVGRKSSGTGRLTMRVSLPLSHPPACCPDDIR